MNGRRDLRVIRNRILLAAVCLFVLTACSAGSQEINVFETLESDARVEASLEDSASAVDTVEKTAAGSTEQETAAAGESGEMIIRPLTYQVDLTHDEMPELLIVEEVPNGAVPGVQISVLQGETVIWSDNLDITDGVTRKAYFLCSLSGEDYLAAYRAYLEEDKYRYIFEVFDLEGDRVRHVDNEMLLFGAGSVNGYPLDSEEINQFSNWINWYLTRSTLLCSNENNVYSYSTTDVQLRYQELFAEAFSPAELYSDCTTAAQKAERFNSLYDVQSAELDPVENGEPVKPEGFDEIAAEMLAETRLELWMGEELAADRNIWFEEYNGRPLHIILTDESYDSPLESRDIVYYRAESDESIEQIAAKMLEYMIAEMTLDADTRSFSLIDYRISEQEIMDLESGLEACWKSWYEAPPEVGENIRAYVRDWLLYDSEETGFLPVGEDMWYFVPQGYFLYEGECRGMTMEEAAANAPETVVGGKIPFLEEGSTEKPVFVLIKSGTLYRLQSVSGMESIYAELTGR